MIVYNILNLKSIFTVLWIKGVAKTHILVASIHWSPLIVYDPQPTAVGLACVQSKDLNGGVISVKIRFFLGLSFTQFWGEE